MILSNPLIILNISIKSPRILPFSRLNKFSSLSLSSPYKKILAAAATHHDDDTTEAEQPHHGISNAFRNANRTGAANNDVDQLANPEAPTPPELPETRRTQLRELTLLGTPISTNAVPEMIEAASRATARLIERVEKIDSHAAPFFLSRYASVPRYTYLRHAAPTFQATQQQRGNARTHHSLLQRFPIQRQLDPCLAADPSGRHRR